METETYRNELNLLIKFIDSVEWKIPSKSNFIFFVILKIFHFKIGIRIMPFGMFC